MFIAAGLTSSAQYLRAGPRSLKQRSTLMSAESPVRPRRHGHRGKRVGKLLQDVLELDASRHRPFDLSDVRLGGAAGSPATALRRKSRSSPRLLDPIPPKSLDAATSIEKRVAAKRLLGGLLAPAHAGSEVLSSMLLGRGGAAPNDLAVFGDMPPGGGDSFVLGTAPGAARKASTPSAQHLLQRGRSAGSGVTRKRTSRGRSADGGRRRRRSPARRVAQAADASAGVKWTGHKNASVSFIVCVGRCTRAYGGLACRLTRHVAQQVPQPAGATQQSPQRVEGVGRKLC